MVQATQGLVDVGDIVAFTIANIPEGYLAGIRFAMIYYTIFS